jgi:hypothetical protein
MINVDVLPSFCRSECYIHTTVCSGTVKDVLISREGSQVAAGTDADTYSSYHSNSQFPQIM